MLLGKFNEKKPRQKRGRLFENKWKLFVYMKAYINKSFTYTAKQLTVIMGKHKYININCIIIISLFFMISTSSFIQTLLLVLEFHQISCVHNVYHKKYIIYIMYTGRGLYRQSGISPCPEEFSLCKIEL